MAEEKSKLDDRASTPVEVEHRWSADMWDWPMEQGAGLVRVNNGPDKFEVSLHAPYYLPNEINVKVVNDEVVIHCRHEARPDEFGRVAREVFRAYRLPEDVDVNTLKSELTPRGMLVIHASKKK